MRVAIVTLGCDKNTVDNEYLAGMLEDAGCEVVTREDGRPLDAAVVTTCGFIAAAKEQSIDTIAQLARRKRETASPRRLFVAGCLAQRQSEELLARFPEIDGLVGVGQFKTLTEMIAAVAAEPATGPAPSGETRTNGANGTVAAVSSAASVSPTPRVEIAPEPTVDIYHHLKRRPLESAAHAFLKISDGCNHTCSFCSIPSMKGRLRSVEPEILLAEARDLLARGVKEINLVAQDLSDYGRDRWRDYRLPELLRELCALEGDFWLRCLYYYPGQVTDRFLEAMAEEPKIVKYLEMPLQHLDAGLLRRMKRPFHERNTFEVVERIRAAVPGIALRTTFILGFPGETQKEFQYLLDGMGKLQFDRLGAFEYSREEGTLAEAMDDQVPARTKSQRWRMVMDRQAKISAKLNRRRKGRVERVLVEGFDEAIGYWIARSAADAPGVDAKVMIEHDPSLSAGEFATVRYTKASTYDLHAVVESGRRPRGRSERREESRRIEPSARSIE